MSTTARASITRLLQAGDSGDRPPVDRLVPLLYEELRILAHRQLAGERAGHTLSTTELVHEAYLKLVDHTQVAARGRAYFLGGAARAMRQILVDYARRHGRQKRGGKARAVTLEEHHAVADAFAPDVLDLHEALKDLAILDERSARVVEYRYFGGLTTEETADALGVSVRTVKRDWSMAKAWLYRALVGGGEVGNGSA